MKKYLLFTLVICITFKVFSQLHVVAPKTMMQRIKATDNDLIGRKVEVAKTSPQNTGKTFTDRGKTTWQLSVDAENCDGMIVYFDKLELPEGSSIYAHSEDGKFKTRVFYSNENKNVKTFALPELYTDKLIVEITVPKSLFSQLKAEISEIGTIIKKSKQTSDGFGSTSSCYINVNCPVATDYSDVKRAVAQFVFTANGQIGYCSGTLLNNTALDNTPYFLSAQHCGMESTLEELGQSIFYFNYESPDCSNPTSDKGLRDDAVVGCTPIAASGDQHDPGSPPDGSDFRLLKLNSIPDEYNVYLAGWNRNEVGEDIPMPGAIIQHPLGDIKKISFIGSFENNLVAYSDFSASCIQVNGTGGNVEANSSGSGVFDKNKRVVGTISYGRTGCVEKNETLNGAGGGRFQMHWDQNGTSADRQLKPWLDPLKNQVMVLDGKNKVATNNHEVFSNNSVSVYPNPCENKLNIEYKSLENNKERKVCIYNLLGILCKTVILTKTTSTIDVSDLKRGTYIIRDENNLLSSKLVKK